MTAWKKLILSPVVPAAELMGFQAVTGPRPF